MFSAPHLDCRDLYLYRARTHWNSSIIVNTMDLLRVWALEAANTVVSIGTQCMSTALAGIVAVKQARYAEIHIDK